MIQNHKVRPTVHQGEEAEEAVVLLKEGWDETDGGGPEKQLVPDLAHINLDKLENL